MAGRSGTRISLFECSWSAVPNLRTSLPSPLGFPSGAIGKKPSCQCRRHKRHGFDLWVRKIPRRRKWQPTLYSCLENPTDRGAWLQSMGLQRLNDLAHPLPSPLSVLGWRRIAMAPWSGLRPTCRLHWVRPLPAPRPHCVGSGSAPCPSPAHSAVGSRCSSVPPQAAGRACSNTRSSAGLLDVPGLCFLQGGRW